MVLFVIPKGLYEYEYAHLLDVYTSESWAYLERTRWELWAAFPDSKPGTRSMPLEGPDVPRRRRSRSGSPGSRL